MPLVSVSQLVQAARAGGYALGYFESWNLESLQGVVDAAEQTRSPIIAGFNGDFLCRTTRRAPERLSWYAEMGRAAAVSASIPCGLIFNECPNDEWVRQAVTAGFNLVMPADPETPLEDYTRRVREIVAHAHRHGAAVEAELGELPCGLPGTAQHGGALTDPGVAAEFVRATGVDLLAVSVGNVHILTKGERGIDLDALARLHHAIPEVPLVLHGGTGIGREDIRQAIRLGVLKVNYGTYLKQRYLTAVRRALRMEEANPHELLGIGGERDVMVAGRLAVRDAVLERIEFLNCCGKA